MDKSASTSFVSQIKGIISLLVKWLGKMEVYHPVIFAIYPVLATYSRNIEEVELVEVIRPTLTLLGFSWILFVVFRLVFQDWHRAGFITTLILLVTVFYFYQYRLPQYFFVLGFMVNRHIPVLVFWAIFLSIVNSGWVWRRVRPAVITRYLNLVAIVSIIFPLGIVLQDRFLPSRLEGWRPNLPPVHSTKTPVFLPDIYYIILDGYVRSDVLQDMYGYNNQGFIHELQARGFYVATNSHSNYMMTAFSLASSLNLNYLDFPASFSEDTSNNRKPLRRLFLDNRLMAFLKSYGYHTTAFSSGFNPTRMITADTFIEKTFTPFTPLETLILQTSIAWIPFELIPSGNDFILPGYEAHRNNLLYQFEQLPIVAESTRPDLIFAHFLLPHPPFVFGRDGEFVNPDRPYSVGDGNHFQGSREEYLQSYRDQVHYANRLVLDMLDAILLESPTPPIIIIQGDHGPGAYLDWESLENTCLRERTSILNAYLLPSEIQEKLYDSITPVNSFRIVFDELFGTQLGLLPDRTFYANFSTPYNFINVTESTNLPCNQP